MDQAATRATKSLALLRTCVRGTLLIGGKSYHSLPKDSLWQNVKVQNVFEGTFLDLNCLSGMMQNGNLYVSTS